jgi:uncharacterized membrane protein YagU involved in acid resistance
VLAAILRLGRNQKIKYKKILKFFFSFTLSWIYFLDFYFHVKLGPCHAVGTNGLVVDLPNLKIYFPIFSFTKILYIFKFGEAHSEAIGTDRLATGTPNLKKNFKKNKIKY